MTNKYFDYYDRIVSRAKDRIPPDCYTEKHHIIPRCMGGSDDPDNLVVLTAEEHFVCYLLLVKMYPNNKGLLCAAHLMSGIGRYNTKGRNNNKRYAKLRETYAETRRLPKPPKEELYKLYVIDELGSPKIAEMYGIDTSTCLEWLRYYDIEVRKYILPKKYDIDEQELLNLYLIDGLSIKEILKYYRCAYTFVRDVLIKNGIPLLWGGTKRKIPPPSKEELVELYVNQGLALWEIGEMYGYTRTPVTRWLKTYNIPIKETNQSYITIPPPSKEELVELYVDRKQSLTTVSLKYGAKSSHTAKKWLMEYNIPIRTRNEQNKLRQYHES